MALADMSVDGLTPEEVGLTPEEIEVAKLARKVFTLFQELPQAHPSDLDEMAFHVHAIGRIILARAVIRTYPEHWQFARPRSRSGTRRK